MFSRSLALALLSLVVSHTRADQPNFSGKCTLDPSNSQDTSGAGIDLTIQQVAGKITYQRIVREKDGKETKASFTCQPVGTWCEFDENGHKARVSLLV